MEKRRLTLKTINLSIVMLNTVLGLVYFILGLVNSAYAHIIMSAFGCAVLAWFLYIVQKVFSVRIQYSLHIIYGAYLFFAMALGATIRFYDMFYWWDIFCHIAFGFIGGYFVILLLHLLGDYEKMSANGLCVIIFFCVLALGCVWEIMEFGIDELFQATTQHNFTTGVRDTMEDILSNTSGAVVFMAMYFAYRKTGFDWGIGWFVKDLKNTYSIPRKPKRVKAKKLIEKSEEETLQAVENIDNDENLNI